MNSNEIKPDELTLVTIASEQVWPNINAILYYRPKRLILLHTSDEKRSAKPAQRLKAFCSRNNLLDDHNISLTEIPSDNFGLILSGLAALKDQFGLSSENAIVNLTGGTKYMATALYTFALFTSNIPCVYFEWEKIYTISKAGKRIDQHPPETLPHDLADTIDPHEIARCQAGDAVIEDPGQKLTLKSRWLAADRNRDHFLSNLENRNYALIFETWQEPAPGTHREGDSLELQVAALLLYEGVTSVRRSFQLRVPNPGGGEGSRDQEIDLVFNHGGQRLYFVECKDWKNDPYERLEYLKNLAIEAKSGRETKGIKTAYTTLSAALQSNRTSKFKEDLFHSARLSGLTAKTLWVMRRPPGPHEEDFCKLEGISILLSGNMHEEIPALPCFQRNQP